MKKSLVLILGLSLYGGARAGERLTGPELKELYTDTTFVRVHHKHGLGKTYYAPDGRVRYLSGDGATERDGKWWIDESSNKRCVKWNHKNRAGCHYTERNDDGTYALIHGKKGKELVVYKSHQHGNHLSVNTSGSVASSPYDDLKSKLNNATAQILVNSDPVYKQYAEWRFHADGTLEMIGENEKRKSSWRINNQGRLCMEFKERLRCFKAQPDGSDIKLLAKGKVRRVLLNVHTMN